MKKQLFIALLASVLMVTSVPMAAIAASAPAKSETASSTTADSTVTNSAITTTNSAISTTDTAITTTKGAVTTTDGALTTTDAALSTTNSAITSSGINLEAPAVVAPISLSLDGAYKKMLADSPQVTLAQYNQEDEITKAKTYSEKISTINNFDLDTASKPMLQESRKFANEQAPRNYEASINKLKSDTYEMYYNYKYTEVQVQVAKDNLTRAQSIYNSTLLKYKLGTVSKLDTLNAETTLNTAKDDYSLAINAFEQIKMNFNLFMGYNIHQKVTLTDNLTALAFPSKTVDTAIKEALTNRNEIYGANFSANIATYLLNDVKAYPKGSATYRSARISLLRAQEAVELTPGKVEIDVRTKYMDMKQKYDAVTSGKVSYENSKEASRLAQLQYDSGVITVTDLSGINLTTFNTQQAYYKAILDYNIAVNAYNLASGLGVETVSIQ